LAVANGAKQRLPEAGMADFVELIETDAFATRGREHPHGYRNQAKGEVALPDGGCHVDSPSVSSLGIARTDF